MSTSWQIGLGTCTTEQARNRVRVNYKLDSGAENLELDLTDNIYRNIVERVRQKHKRTGMRGLALVVLQLSLVQYAYLLILPASAAISL